ncbi:MAG: hypothetical protein OXD43_00290 [Bacteroidetes bacterium]|nr:hypothetical protein [Bacteroidota bacterium]
MYEEILIPKASVQYNDFTGTSAADKHDRADIHTFLEEKELISDSQYIVGIRIRVSEVHDHVPDASITVYYLNKGQTLSKAEKIYAKSFDMNVMEVFHLFKRFEILLEPYKEGQLKARMEEVELVVEGEYIDNN